MDNEMTIIDERYEFFENHLDEHIQYGFLERTAWTERAKSIIKDAYCVDINPVWVEMHLKENQYSEIYIRIIQKCRLMKSSIPRDKKPKDILLAKQLDNICSLYRNELLTELTNTIREYCL